MTKGGVRFMMRKLVLALASALLVLGVGAPTAGAEAERIPVTATCYWVETVEQDSRDLSATVSQMHFEGVSYCEGSAYLAGYSYVSLDDTYNWVTGDWVSRFKATFEPEAFPGSSWVGGGSGFGSWSDDWTEFTWTGTSVYQGTGELFGMSMRLTDEPTDTHEFTGTVLRPN
jgi:hypothetical protein